MMVGHTFEVEGLINEDRGVDPAALENVARLHNIACESVCERERETVRQRARSSFKGLMFSEENGGRGKGRQVGNSRGAVSCSEFTRQRLAVNISFNA